MRSISRFTLPLVAALTDIHLNVIPRKASERNRITKVTAPPKDFSTPWTFEENSGGAQTMRARQTADSFSQPAANLSFEQELDFKVGNATVKRLWVSPPRREGTSPTKNQSAPFRRRRRHPAQTDLPGRRPRIWPTAPQGDAFPPHGPADDRHGSP
jgi:hypothetical protein